MRSTQLHELADAITASLVVDDAVRVPTASIQTIASAEPVGIPADIPIGTPPIRGADRVARFRAFVIRRRADGGRVARVTLNGGAAALVTTGAGEIIGAVFVEPAADAHASAIRWIRNPSTSTPCTEPSSTLENADFGPRPKRLLETGG